VSNQPYGRSNPSPRPDAEKTLPRAFTPLGGGAPTGHPSRRPGGLTELARRGVVQPHADLREHWEQPEPAVGGYGDRLGAPGARPRVRHRHNNRSAWHWLLAVPSVLPLLVPLYNRVHPMLWGIPFFYWYQLACALIAVAVITFVYQVTKE
jgi:hypothetical protein